MDGEPVEERIEAMWPVVTASRPSIRRIVAFRWSLAGPEDSSVVLTVSGADGARREVEVRRGRGGDPAPRRRTRTLGAPDPQRTRGPLTVGYVDLDRAAKSPRWSLRWRSWPSTDAIVFDMRGYPHGTAWALAPRLNVKGATDWARFRRREVSYESLSLGGSDYAFVQRVPRRRT